MMDSTFWAATWNVFHGTPVDTLKPTLLKLSKRKVGILLIQEGSQQGLMETLQNYGYAAFRFNPQYVVAWLNMWTAVDSYGVRLAAQSYGRVGGSTAYVDAACAILSDKVGRTLSAMSYHLPSHVQVANKPPRRIAALREAMGTMSSLAKQAQTRSVLFGGDDNVDERLKHGPWDFMLEKATGLKQVQAPDPTHGSRKIDDFRVRALRPLNGYTLSVPAPDDHNVHVREFKWV